MAANAAMNSSICGVEGTASRGSPASRPVFCLDIGRAPRSGPERDWFARLVF